MKKEKWNYSEMRLMLGFDQLMFLAKHVAAFDEEDILTKDNCSLADLLRVWDEDHKKNPAPEYDEEETIENVDNLFTEISAVAPDLLDEYNGSIANANSFAEKLIYTLRLIFDFKLIKPDLDLNSTLPLALLKCGLNLPKFTEFSSLLTGRVWNYALDGYFVRGKNHSPNKYAAYELIAFVLAVLCVAYIRLKLKIINTLIYHAGEFAWYVHSPQIHVKLPPLFWIDDLTRLSTLERTFQFALADALGEAPTVLFGPDNLWFIDDSVKDDTKWLRWEKVKQILRENLTKELARFKTDTSTESWDKMPEPGPDDEFDGNDDGLIVPDDLTLDDLYSDLEKK